MVDPKIKAAVDESFRRKANLGASSAGIGADVANSTNPANPMASAGTVTPTGGDAPIPSGGAAGSPTDGTMQAAKQQKSESQRLTDTMIYRLKKLTERGE